MRKLRFGRPSPAIVISCVALFVALATGSAIAAKKIGPGQIKKGAVKTKKIAEQAVTTEKLADAAVTEPKLADDAVSKQKLQPQSVGSAKIEDLAVRTGKLEDGAVTGAKVPNGSLGLAKIAQVNIATSVNPGDTPFGECVHIGLSVSGLQAGDAILVIPRGEGGQWNANWMLDGYGPDAAPTIGVQVCNIESAGSSDPDPLPIRVLGFRPG